jgi:hypothetical protein
MCCDQEQRNVRVIAALIRADVPDSRPSTKAVDLVVELALVMECGSEKAV